MTEPITLEDIRTALNLIEEGKEEVLWETENVIVTGRYGIPETITLKKKAAAEVRMFAEEQTKRNDQTKSYSLGKVTTFCGVPIFVTDEKNESEHNNMPPMREDYH